MPALGLVYVILAFLSGTILFSYHLPLWIKHVDIVEQSADHNPGTANAFKLAGIPVGLMCLLMDMGKGFLPVCLAVYRFGPHFSLLPFIMAAPAFGHAFSPWYPFRGGKAIATAFGVLAALLPFSPAVWVLVFWYLFFSLVVVVHPNEKRSVITFLLFTATCAALSFYTRHHVSAVGCALLSLAPIMRNHADVERAKRALEAAEHAPKPLT